MRVERAERIRPGLALYCRVLVDRDELVVASEKHLPYSTWIGTFNLDRVNLWCPASSSPRGYKEAAMKILVRASHDYRYLLEEISDE